MRAIPLTALLMGLCIGLSAIMLQSWVGDRGWLARIVALLLVGGLLCGIQFGVLLRRRRR